MRLASRAKTRALAPAALCAGLLFGCAAPARPHTPLSDVHSFAMVSISTGVDALSASRYEALIIVDPTLVGKDVTDFIHQSHKLLLAEIEVPRDMTLLDRTIAAGFDGALLLIPANPADAQARDERARTIATVQQIADYARAKRPAFGIVVLDAADLVTEPVFARSVDGIAQRSLWFIAASRSGDIRQEAGYRAALLPALRGAAAAGIPVFTIDFASNPHDAETVYQSARAEHFIAYVTASTAAGLTKTPPPGL